MVFLLFISFPAFSQELGRFNLEIRATEEEAGPNHYWYYLYFTHTFSPDYTKIQEIIDIWATMHTSGYFRRTGNGFELKARYLKTNKFGILNTWLDFDRSGGPGRGIFNGAALLVRQEYDLIVRSSNDWDTFDYEWTNMGYFEQHGYYRYETSYAFYKRE
jgi:hypothetical protein